MEKVTKLAQVKRVSLLFWFPSLCAWDFSTNKCIWKNRWTRCHDYKKHTMDPNDDLQRSVVFKFTFYSSIHLHASSRKWLSVATGLKQDPWNHFSLIKWSKDKNESKASSCSTSSNFSMPFWAWTSQSLYWNDQSSVPKEQLVWGKRRLINISTNHLLCSGRGDVSDVI